MTKLSVCIITLNEEARLPHALESVRGLADEVVVVDSGSTDRTREIARAAGATVIEHAWSGFGAQRNVALGAASCEWVLELDADEWCSDDFAQEITRFLALPPPEPFRMVVTPMRQRFLGRMLGPSAHYPFYRSRVFRRDSYRHDESRTVHEGLWPKQRPWVFHEYLGHELAGDLGEAVRDVVAYARLQSLGMDGVSAQSLLVGILLRPPIKFLYRTVLLGGWRDGAQGTLHTALECAGDVLTWLYAMRSRRRSSAAGGHFGRVAPRDGPVFLLAVGNPSGQARAWLQEAVRAGAWVSVICSRRDASTSLDGDAQLRITALPRMGPLSVLRALDAEAQLAPVDSYVALDRVGERMLALLPFAAQVVRPHQRDPVDLVRSAR